jgi:hypothetical protein
MALDYLKESIVKPLKELEGKYLLEVFWDEKVTPGVTRQIVSESVLIMIKEPISEIHGVKGMKVYKIVASSETLPDGSISIKPSLEEIALSKLPEKEVIELTESDKEAIKKVQDNFTF